MKFIPSILVMLTLYGFGFACGYVYQKEVMTTEILKKELEYIRKCK